MLTAVVVFFVVVGFFWLLGNMSRPDSESQAEIKRRLEELEQRERAARARESLMIDAIRDVHERDTK